MKSLNNNISETILKNNITLITESIDTVKTVAIGFWFSCGSRYEKKGEKGVTHFVEHMLFKGTKNRSAYEIASSFDRIGGYVNAFTEREQVCLHCVVPAMHAKTAITILCDMVENSVFLQEEVERERKVIESEIISSLDDGEEMALDASIQVVWPKNSISDSIIAAKKDIKKIKRELLINWYKTYFVHGSVTVTASGNIERSFLSEALCLLSRKKAVRFDVQLFTRPEWKKGINCVEADFQQEQIFALYPIKVPFTQREYYTLAIVNALIGDTMSSRLFQALREKSGECYTVYSFVSIYSDCAYWCAYASTSKKNVLSVLTSLQNELANIVINGFTDNEILAAKEHIVGEEIIASEDMEQRMKFLSKNFYLGFNQCSLEDTIDNIRLVTKDDINSVIDKVLNKEQEALLVYGPSLPERVKKSI